MIDHVFPHSADWKEKPIKGFHQIVHAGNGEFIRAKRAGLHAIIQISEICESVVTSIDPVVEVEKKISAAAIAGIYKDFLRHLPNERLIWISKDGMMLAPRQRASQGMVKALDPFHPSLEHVIFDVHSHNKMEAYFSGQDDEDESKGFRVYIVIGRVGSKRPQIAARIGCFGHFQNVPIQTVADLPSALKFEDIHEA